MTGKVIASTKVTAIPSPKAVFTFFDGTAGIKLLSSKDAKKAYTHTTAAILGGLASGMTTVTTIKENADDILADAKEINEQRAAKEESIEDVASEDVFSDESTENNEDAPAEATAETETKVEE